MFDILKTKSLSHKNCCELILNCHIFNLSVIYFSQSTFTLLLHLLNVDGITNVLTHCDQLKNTKFTVSL